MGIHVYWDLHDRLQIVGQRFAVPSSPREIRGRFLITFRFL